MDDLVKRGTRWTMNVSGITEHNRNAAWETRADYISSAAFTGISS